MGWGWGDGPEPEEGPPGAACLPAPPASPHPAQAPCIAHSQGTEQLPASSLLRQPAALKIVSDVSCLELLLLLAQAPYGPSEPSSPCQVIVTVTAHLSNLPQPPLPYTFRVTELVQQVTGRVPEPGQRVLVLELSCEGEEDDTTFPPLHYEL